MYTKGQRENNIPFKCVIIAHMNIPKVYDPKFKTPLVLFWSNKQLSLQTSTHWTLANTNGITGRWKFIRSEAHPRVASKKMDRWLAPKSLPVEVLRSSCPMWPSSASTSRHVLILGFASVTWKKIYKYISQNDGLLGKSTITLNKLGFNWYGANFEKNLYLVRSCLGMVQDETRHCSKLVEMWSKSTNLGKLRCFVAVKSHSKTSQTQCRDMGSNWKLCQGADVLIRRCL